MHGQQLGPYLPLTCGNFHLISYPAECKASHKEEVKTAAFDTFGTRRVNFFTF